jgi:hypothetical protein
MDSVIGRASSCIPANVASTPKPKFTAIDTTQTPNVHGV